MKKLAEYFKTTSIKLSHWEYWNSTIIYLPIFPYLLFLMVKSRSFFFFRAANPGIENGGFTMESKWKIQADCNHEQFPKTILVKPNSPAEILNEISANFSFPLILKPDIGGKGRGVVQVNTTQDLAWYNANCPIPFLVQEKITYPLEIGIFYAKYPNESTGRITGIVSKAFIEVVGDGISSILQLLESNPRYLIQLEKLKAIVDPKILHTIPNKGSVEVVTEIGNHAQGSKFEDSSARINKALTRQIEKLARNLPGFYFGRMDIRFSSWAELEAGKNFSIIEINGSGSEPTHIYDSNHSIFFAWKEITRHWNIMSKIAQHNSKKENAYLNFKQGFRLISNHVSTMRKLDKFSSSITLQS